MPGNGQETEEVDITPTDVSEMVVQAMQPLLDKIRALPPEQRAAFKLKSAIALLASGMSILMPMPDEEADAAWAIAKEYVADFWKKHQLV